MEYEAPELTAVTSAIGAIQRNALGVKMRGPWDGFPAHTNDDTPAYEDWE